MDPHASGTRREPTPTSRRTSEALWDWDLVSNRIHFSPAWLALAGWHDHEIGNTPDDWVRRVHHDDQPQLRREIEAARTGESPDFELRYRLRHSDGRYRWMRSHGRIVRNDRGEAIRLAGAQADVTAETVTDPVTGLPNRLLLIEHLAQSIKRARRHLTFHFAVLIIDLGRPPGPVLTSRSSSDPLLNSAARRLETCLRMPDAMPDGRQSDLAVRIDGDRFAVLLDGVIDLSHAKGIADRILAEMLNPLQINGRDVRLSPAIGIALSASGYTEPEEPLRDAEIALHRARVLGGSHSELFDANLLHSEQSALQLERELETALQRGEFVLLYQPVVSLASNTVIGFEALVRWQHPTLGRISPLDFIPLAERTGLIVPMSRWILETACEQLRAWQAVIPEAQSIWMSVNLSAVQLREAAFVEDIQAALQRTGADPSHLTLELTEGVAMENPVAVTTVLMRLRAMGVRISLDDFGTGYSSLAYLRQFPVDGLKIDQSFIRRLGNDKNTTAIVTGILSMAKELGLSVVAEGVEHEEQQRVLQTLDCGAAQGYLYAQPLDAEAAADYLQAGPPLSATVVSNDSPAADGRPVQPWLAQWVSWVGHRVVATSAVVGVLDPRRHWRRVLPRERHTRSVASRATAISINTRIVGRGFSPGIRGFRHQQAATHRRPAVARRASERHDGTSRHRTSDDGGSFSGRTRSGNTRSSSTGCGAGACHIRRRASSPHRRLQRPPERLRNRRHVRRRQQGARRRVHAETRRVRAGPGEQDADHQLRAKEISFHSAGEGVGQGRAIADRPDRRRDRPLPPHQVIAHIITSGLAKTSGTALPSQLSRGSPVLIRQSRLRPSLKLRPDLAEALAEAGRWPDRAAMASSPARRSGRAGRLSRERRATSLDPPPSRPVRRSACAASRSDAFSRPDLRRDLPLNTGEPWDKDRGWIRCAGRVKPGGESVQEGARQPGTGRRIREHAEHLLPKEYAVAKTDPCGHEHRRLPSSDVPRALRGRYVDLDTSRLPRRNHHRSR